MFISPEDPCGDIAKHRPILLRFTQKSRRVSSSRVDTFLLTGAFDLQAQKYMLGGIEQLIVKYKATLLPKTTHILKALYDEDIIEEEQLLEWGKKVGSFASETLLIYDHYLRAGEQEVRIAR